MSKESAIVEKATTLYSTSMEQQALDRCFLELQKFYWNKIDNKSRSGRAIILINSLIHIRITKRISPMSYKNTKMYSMFEVLE